MAQMSTCMLTLTLKESVMLAPRVIIVNICMASFAILHNSIYQYHYIVKTYSYCKISKC